MSGEDETVGAATARAEAALAEAGIDTPRLDARILVAAAIDATPGDVFLHPDRAFAPDAAHRLEELLARRADREPVSRILGRREFWSLEFALSPDTLDPRPDSETLIEAALAALPARAQPLRILDLGTGTGCLLLALLSELPRATGLGIDISSGACTSARENAARLGFAPRAEFRQGSWEAAGGARFNLIVTNPPYIRTGDMAGLAPEVARYDPETALAAGPDGLDAYRAIAPVIAAVLAPGGAAFVEIGDGQATEVTAIFSRAGLRVPDVKPDLAGRLRCLVAARDGGVPPVWV